MLIFLFLLSSMFAQAQTPSDVDFDRRIFMPRSLGLSGSMVSRINLNESLYFNPASSAHSRVFSAEAGYAWNNLSQFTAGRMDTYYVNAVDTDSPLFGGGVGYYKRKVKGGFGSEWEARGIINRAMFSKKFAFGIGASYLSSTYFNQSSNNFNLDLGVLYLVTKKTIIGATAFNLLGDDTNLRSRSIDIGVRQTFWDFFSMSLDVEHRFDKKINVSGAFEMLYRNGILVTISGRRNQYLKNNYWGLGLGYIAPKISVIYGTMNAISYPYNFMHSFSLRVFF